jgi:hypothetical protein
MLSSISDGLFRTGFEVDLLRLDARGPSCRGPERARGAKQPGPFFRATAINAADETKIYYTKGYAIIRIGGLHDRLNDLRVVLRGAGISGEAMPDGSNQPRASAMISGARVRNWPERDMPSRRLMSAVRGRPDSARTSP